MTYVITRYEQKRRVLIAEIRCEIGRLMGQLNASHGGLTPGEWLTILGELQTPIVVQQLKADWKDGRTADLAEEAGTGDGEIPSLIVSASDDDNEPQIAVAYCPKCRGGLLQQTTHRRWCPNCNWCKRLINGKEPPARVWWTTDRPMECPGCGNRDLATFASGTGENERLMFFCKKCGHTFDSKATKHEEAADD